MKILIVGLGSIARRHIQHLKGIDRRLEIGVWRQRSKRKADAEIDPLISRYFFRVSDALQWQPQAVIICNPAPLHVPVAMKFAKAGCHLFLEKPVSDSMKGLDALGQMCRRKKLTVMVGYVLRFSKPLQAIKAAIDGGKIGKVLSAQAWVGRNLLNWRSTDYRKNVSARKELGGGVVLELSHELDYLRWMLGEAKEVSAMTGRIGGFDINVEDIAQINIKFASGALGQVHLDMLDHAPYRGCRIIGTKGTLAWDMFDGNKVKFCSSKEGQWKSMYSGKRSDYQTTFRREMEHFLDRVRRRKRCAITVEDGIKTLKLALAAKESARKKKAVRI